MDAVTGAKKPGAALLRKARRVVVKVGSALLVDPSRIPTCRTASSPDSGSITRPPDITRSQPPVSAGVVPPQPAPTSRPIPTKANTNDLPSMEYTPFSSSRSGRWRLSYQHEQRSCYFRSALIS